MGAGRRAADGATGVERITILVTPEQRKAIAELGGSVFVRAAIDASIGAAGGTVRARSS